MEEELIHRKIAEENTKNGIIKLPNHILGQNGLKLVSPNGIIKVKKLCSYLK